MEDDETCLEPAVSLSSRQPHFPSSRVVITTARIRQWLAYNHGQTPYLRRLPLNGLLMIVLLVVINVITWAIAGIVLAARDCQQLIGSCLLAYSLGLRHALDADHISAIDLMTRRLVATGQRSATVGTFFSLGHSTIVIITSVVVAATAAGVQKRLGRFSDIGGIIGNSVSAAFLVLLGLLNAYILYRLYVQMQKIIPLPPHEAELEGFNVQGGGVMFRVLKGLFKLVNRPWKMYPVGVLFGLGFDTSSEIALLGISSVQGAAGTTIWLILLFPVLFTVGMCLIDTIDGALMMSLYVAPLDMGADHDADERGRAIHGEFTQSDSTTEHGLTVQHKDGAVTSTDPLASSNTTNAPQRAHTCAAANVKEPTTSNRASTSIVHDDQTHPRWKDPLTFLYYSFILTVLTVICALVIGVLQLLTLVLNTVHPTGRFWDGVAAAGDAYEYIGAAICGMFILVGSISVFLYPRWRRWVDEQRKAHA